MPDEWYRSPDWTPAAQEEFEARLRRARAHNRAQYLRIKGVALRDAGQVDAARTLWSLVVDGHSEPAFERAFTLELLANSHVVEDPATAERYLRELLHRHPTLNGTSHTAEITLAELLLDRGGRQATADTTAEATALLDSFLARGVAQLPDVLFRWHLALIRVAEATGEKETVRRAARTALDLADRGPVFSRHRDVGVVDAPPKTLRRLRRLAR